MTISVDVQIACEDDDHPSPSQLQQWVKVAINTQLNDAELTIRIVGEVEITQLNNHYRGKNIPTNVLSFPADLPDHIELPLLGDLVICSAVVEREAIQQQKPIHSHWAHMVIHGTLHLLGYDHVDDQDADKMESLEVQLLAELNIPNPYLTELERNQQQANQNDTVMNLQEGNT